MFPTLSLAHSMSPGFEVEQAFSPVFEKSYKLTNHYDFPAVYVITVHNKDMTVATDWKVEKEEYRLNSGN